jgi:hypothetical protein
MTSVGQCTPSRRVVALGPFVADVQEVAADALGAAGPDMTPDRGAHQLGLVVSQGGHGRAPDEHEPAAVDEPSMSPSSTGPKARAPERPRADFWHRPVVVVEG